MDPPEVPIGRPSPRRELQGPRPTPLKVNKDSYKIRKPPLAPPPQLQQASQQPPLPPPPVIIYAVSPKVIHTSASDFMSLVQRLTGLSSSSSSAGAPSQSGAHSPAARLAAIERTQNYDPPTAPDAADVDIFGQFDIPVAFDRSAPGILSPLPSSLPPISPNFFSPLADPTSLSFLQDLSPLYQNKNYIEGTFVPSPTAAFISTPVTSPTLSFDLFNQFLD